MVGFEMHGHPWSQSEPHSSELQALGQVVLCTHKLATRLFTSCCRALDVYGLMTQLPGVHPDSSLYRTIISTFHACGAPDMVLQVALIMAQQVGLHHCDRTSVQARRVEATVFHSRLDSGHLHEYIFRMQRPSLVAYHHRHH